MFDSLVWSVSWFVSVSTPANGEQITIILPSLSIEGLAAQLKVIPLKNGEQSEPVPVANTVVGHSFPVLQYWGS